MNDTIARVMKCEAIARKVSSLFSLRDIREKTAGLPFVEKRPTKEIREKTREKETLRYSVLSRTNDSRYRTQMTTTTRKKSSASSYGTVSENEEDA